MSWGEGEEVRAWWRGEEVKRGRWRREERRVVCEEVKR